MPIIYSYPSKISPSSGDLLIISDVTASNQTKKITIGDLRDPLDVVDTIIPGDGISVSSPTGDVTISNTGVLEVEVGSFVNSFGIPLASVDAGGGTTRLFLYKYAGGSNVGFVPSGGNSSTFLKGNGTWAVPTKASPSLPLNGVQYRDNNGNFAAASSLIFESNIGKLIVGDAANDIYGIVEIQSDNDSGAELKIQGGGGFYTTIRGSQSDTASYNITLPVAGPGGNDKILQSDSSGNLSWVDTPSGGSSLSVANQGSYFTNDTGKLNFKNSDYSSLTASTSDNGLEVAVTTTPLTGFSPTPLYQATKDLSTQMTCMGMYVTENNVKVNKVKFMARNVGQPDPQTPEAFIAIYPAVDNLFPSTITNFQPLAVFELEPNSYNVDGGLPSGEVGIRVASLIHPSGATSFNRPPGRNLTIVVTSKNLAISGSFCINDSNYAAISADYVGDFDSGSATYEDLRESLTFESDVQILPCLQFYYEDVPISA